MVNVDKIKALAKEKGFKLGKLCELLGEDQNYFNKVKLGLRRMDDNRIVYLAEKLGTSYDYLVDLTDSPFPLPIVDSYPHFSFERFHERCRTKGVTVGYIENRLGLRQDDLEKMEYLQETPDEQLVNRMAILLNTTSDYLLCLSNNPTVPLDDKTGIKIKVFGDVAAGIPIQQIDNFDPEDPDSWEEINRETAKSGIYFALKIKGDSMSPRILEGDIVIVRKQPMVESGQLAVVAINGDTATCKKVLWDEQGGMFLVSLNSAYPPRYFSSADVQNRITILGLVVELRAKTF